MEAMLRTGRFAEFVREVIAMHNADTEEKTLWEAWLHKCYDKSFDEFRRSLGLASDAVTDVPTTKEMENTVKQSFDMLAAFNPLEGADGDGAIPAAGENQH